MAKTLSTPEKVIQPQSNPFLFRIGVSFLAGLAAALVASAVMIALRLTLGTITLPELFAERTLPLIPVDLFIKSLVLFHFSKAIPLGLALLGQTVLGIFIGPFYAFRITLPRQVRSYLPGRKEFLLAGSIAAVLWIVGVALFWPVLPSNLSGYPVTTARLLTMLSIALTFGLYALTLAFSYRVLIVERSEKTVAAPETPTPEAAPDTHPEISRRQLLGGASVAIVSVVAAGSNALLIRELLARSSTYDGSTPGLVNGATLPITPTKDFYSVTKNFIDPMPSSGSWRLDLGGMLKNPGSYNYKDIRALPAIEMPITMECISNDVGGHLMSTAVWRGVTLQTLLQDRGGITPGANRVIFRGVDDFTSSLPLEDLLSVGTLLAYEMNGEPLPSRHGFPLRVIVPGRFGEQSPKWITEITLVNYDYKGFYQSQGWSDKPVHTTSRIDRPSKPISKTAVQVGGVAFSGTRGISKVEVSVDRGATWREATLQPALSRNTWVLWTWEWAPPAIGTYHLVARATDGTGALQTSKSVGTVPNGATGWPMVTVEVK